MRGPLNDPTLPTLPTRQPVSVSNSPCVSFLSGIPQTPVSQGSGYFGRRKPATYDGSSSWKYHLVQFELVADLNRWPEDIKALELAASLRGVAQGVLSDLPADQRKHYTSLVNRLTARFEPENQSEIYRARLKTRIRKKDEDLGTLAQEISHLVRKAYPSVSIEMQDRFALDAFIDALNDSDMEWAVHQGHPVSLQDASKVAHEYEAFRTGRGRKNILVRGRIQGIQKENPVFMPKSKTGPRHPMRRKQHEKSQWLGKCYFCQKEGHWIHECRGMQKAIPDPKWRENLMSLIKSSKTQPPDKKGNIAGCTPSYDDRGSLGQEKGTSVKSVDHGMSSIAGKVGGTIAQSDLTETVPTPVSSSESLYVPIMINGILVNGLVDSGATIESQMVLGYDFLNMHKCSLDFGEGVLSIGKNKVACLRLNPSDENVHITVKETVTVPANSEAIIPVTIFSPSSSPLPTESMCINSVSGMRYQEGLMVARILIDPRQEPLQLRMGNLSDQPVKLPKNTFIATGEPVNVTVGSVNPNTCPENTNLIQDETQVISVEQEEIPEHLYMMWQEFDPFLTYAQKSKVLTLLFHFQDTFIRNKNDLGQTDLVSHRINTGNSAPIKQAARRLPLAKRAEAEKEVRQMLDRGIIEPSASPWSSPVVLVKKKDGSVRFCIDYRRLNCVTVKDSYPLPRIDDSLDCLGKAKWFSTLDLASGYWQVPLYPDDQEKTAFVTQSGLYHFKVLPFGLCNAPATFQRLMECVLAGLQWQICLLYIDDI